MFQYGVVVIGVDPGGYIAAIRAAQLGFKTTCVDTGVNKADDAPALSGTCLNVGRILSKALLQSSEYFHTAQRSFAERGISVGDIKFDAAKMVVRRDTIATRFAGGMKFLFQKDKVTSLFGMASFAGKNDDACQIKVDNKGEKAVVEAKHVVVAAGSVPCLLPQVAIDNVNVLDNEGTLNLTEVPARLDIIGSGMVSLEMGSVWNHIGSQVTILEAMPTFLAAVNQQTAREAFKYFTEEQGLSIELGMKIGNIKSEAKGVSVAYQTAAGEAKTRVSDKSIVIIDRAPNTKGLNAETVGLEKDKRGFIRVDGEYRTNLPNVWAIGDTVRGPTLAHKASDEGVVVTERIASQRPHIDFNNVPLVIYVDPEIAWVGKTEKQLEARDAEYKRGTPGFGISGRALTMGKAEGTVKALTDTKTDRILSVHMIGPAVNELVTEDVTTLEFSASNEGIARITHAHPTLSEVVHEAALAADRRALHG